MIRRISFLLCIVICACGAPKTLVLNVPESRPVPFALDVSQLTDNPGGRWFLNGEEVQLTSTGELLFTQSGTYDITYRYYQKGHILTTKTRVEALPPKDYCHVEICTPKGNLVVQLSHLAQRHSDYFEDLVQQGYYDSLIFHRIVPGFVIQGGNAEDTPFQRSTDVVMKSELEPEFHEDLLHYRGALAMARMPDEMNPEKKSSPDQFYLVQGTPYTEERWEQFLTEQGSVYKSYQKERYLEEGGSPQLDGEYTVFGYVTHGHQVLDSLTYIPTTMQRPDQPVWMIIRKVE